MSILFMSSGWLINLLVKFELKWKFVSVSVLIVSFGTVNFPMRCIHHVVGVGLSFIAALKFR